MNADQKAPGHLDDAVKLATRNLAFFRLHASDLHQKIIPFMETAKRTARSRAAFKSMRFHGEFPSGKDIDVFTFALLQNTLNHASPHQVAYFDNPRSVKAYFLYVVGLPTDTEFKQLLVEFQPFCLIINEPDLQLLANSLYEVDWARHLFILQSYGGTVQFEVDKPANQAAQNVWRICRAVNPTRADNFTCVILDHHEHAAEIEETLARDLNLIGTNLGFFQDELLMLRNNYRNVTSGKTRLYRRTNDTKIEGTVFVVGSGASLDDDLAFIRAHQNDAVIVSAGSALRPLLNAGITPDFQIENENWNVSYRMEDAAKDFDISGVRLVASSTVEREALDTTENETVLYYRTALSPFPMFDADVENSLRLPDPTVGNAALCFALERGFSHVYIFGLDLGSRDAVQHHSKASIYHTLGVAHERVYDIPVPGNFQDTIWTTRIFHPAIKNATDVIRALGKDRTVINCADGAKLGDIPAVRSGDLTLFEADVPKRDLVEKIVASFDVIDPNTPWEGAAIQHEITTFAEAVHACLMDEDTYLNGQFQAPLMQLLDLEKAFVEAPRGGIPDTVMILFRGTLLALVLFLEFYACRVATEKHERLFRLIAREELLKIFDYMVELALDLLGGDQPKDPPPIEERYAPKSAQLPKLRRLARNQICTCGSGRKYKDCHGKKKRSNGQGATTEPRPSSPDTAPGP